MAPLNWRARNAFHYFANVPGRGQYQVKMTPSANWQVTLNGEPIGVCRDAEMAKGRVLVDLSCAATSIAS